MVYVKIMNSQLVFIPLLPSLLEFHVFLAFLLHPKNRRKGYLTYITSFGLQRKFPNFSVFFTK